MSLCAVTIISMRHIILTALLSTCATLVPARAGNPEGLPGSSHHPWEDPLISPPAGWKSLSSITTCSARSRKSFSSTTGDAARPKTGHRISRNTRHPRPLGPSPLWPKCFFSRNSRQHSLLPLSSYARLLKTSKFIQTEGTTFLFS
jgi:hypothetical protein